MNKILTLCLIVIIVLSFVGCFENKTLQDDLSTNSDISGENFGQGDVQLPDDDFDFSEDGSQTDDTSGTSSSTQYGSQDLDISTENNGHGNSSDNNGKGSSQENSSQNSSSLNKNEEENSSETKTEDDTSSSVTSTPSKKEDGTIELPMDKW